MVVPESYLTVDVPGMALSTITTAYVNRRYILGGYEAEYNFPASPLLWSTYPGFLFLKPQASGLWHLRVHFF